MSLSIFVGSSNVYLELKRGVPRIHLISIHYVFITPSFCMCLYLLYLFFLPIVIFLSIFIAISIFLNLNCGEVSPWCSRSHFPFCWWTMEIQYRLLARILNVSIEHIKIIGGIFDFERVECIEHLNEWILNILTHIVKTYRSTKIQQHSHVLLFLWIYLRIKPFFTNMK